MKQYIDKSVVVDEILKKMDKYNKLHSFNYGAVKDLESLLNFINTLEVKEADLKKEIDEVIYKLNNNRYTPISSADIEWIAKHFFELGIKAKGDKL